MRASGSFLKQVMGRRRLWPASLLIGAMLAVSGLPVRGDEPSAGSAPTGSQSVSPVVRIDWSVPDAFTQGLAAIAQGDNAAVAGAVSTLGVNPLATYLQFRWLMDTVNQNPDRVEDFLKAHPSYPFSKDLKAALLRSLARQNAWASYLAAVDLPPTLKPTRVRTCQMLQAAIETNAMDAQRIELAERVWAVGHSQPDECDPVFTWLHDHDRLTPALYHKRIRAAVLAGNISLGKYLVKTGSVQKIRGLDAYLAGWSKVEQAPEQVVRDDLAQRADHVLGAEERAQLIQALTILSRLDPAATHDYLGKLPTIWAVPQADRDDIARRVALKAAYTRMPEAYDWLKALPSSVQDEETRTWLARAALRAEDWPRLKAAISAMPEDLAQQSEWQYWLARADDALGDEASAKARWRALLPEPDYYGFLAADRLGMAYPWPKLPPLPRVSVEQVARLPAVQLAFYLRAVNLTDDARRAFSYALDEIPADQLPALTLLAEQSQWYDRVSIAIARMGKQNDPSWFAARFPTPWHGEVNQQAAQQGVDPNWLYAMIRRESLFMSDVGSGVGAQGLMQLMPRTASWINRKAGLGLNDPDLHDPQTSITLGAAYLSYLNQRFSGQLPLAVAAYNAGPGRVRQWLPESRTLPGDVWVDTILFDETRHYVRAVLAATVIYAWRDRKVDGQKAGQKADDRPAPETLMALLTPIQPLNPPSEDQGDTAAVSPAAGASSPIAAVSSHQTVPGR
ncbi:hypothetical protein A9404_01375 [Halothiobacillus diazotrophicus]|uniref:Transglycosylase SLT domain-containing protein n=2 Tax=Halothiobacillus diazotrophicus TaxID=1860122 RepID=A0A191ZEA7_9GAMM|nr:hypothetical protein A9404_01375 [Halothiobacillus diazotrophicus]